MFISLPFLSQETLSYSDSFHAAYRIKLAFKLRNMEKTWGKNDGTCKNVTIDCSSSTFTAQTDTLFKTLKGEMVTTLNQQHIPI